MSSNQKTITYSAIAGLTLAAILLFPDRIEKITADQVVVEFKDPFADIALQAKSVYVYDSATKEVLYAENENASMPLASIAKIMTAITAADLAPKGTVVTITSEALQKEGDSGLYGDEQWLLDELLRFSLVVSSNDGMAAIAAALGSHEQDITFDISRGDFVKKMNTKAALLGYPSLVFNNETGLDESTTTAGAYGSAKDTALLLEYAMNKYGDIMHSTRYQNSSFSSLSKLNHYAANTDEIAGTIPGLIAGKTGFSDLAGGNLAVVFDAGLQHPVVVVVLGSTYDGRFTDIQKIISAVIAKLSYSAV